MSPFQKTDVHEGRLVWDPSVHQRLYDENCYYFLIRIRSPELDLVGRFKGILSKALVRSFCIYVLYGYYDLLIRVWATTQKRRTLIAEFQQVANITESVREFQVNSIRYLWASIHPEENRLLDYKQQIVSVCKQVALDQLPDPQTVNMLKSVGVLHELATRQPSMIKFYIAFSAAGDSHPPVPPELISEVIQKASPDLHDVSIYSGIGFASYLVKAVAADYGSISETTSRIFSSLRGAGLRPMTLLIADNKAPEADLIDIEWEDFSRDLLQLVQFLGPKAEPLIARLQTSERDSVSRLFAKNSYLLGTSFGVVLEGLFLARLQEDKALLVEKFSFVLRLELLLRKFFIDLLSVKLGVDWFRIVQSAAVECSLDGKKNPSKEYTMHDYITVAGQLIARGKLSNEDVESVLGSEWTARMLALKDLRNEFAHGRMFADSFILVQQWEHVVTVSCDVGGTYNTLVDRFPN